MHESWEDAFDELVYAYNRGDDPEQAYWEDGHGVLAISRPMQEKLKTFIADLLAQDHTPPAH